MLSLNSLHQSLVSRFRPYHMNLEVINGAVSSATPVPTNTPVLAYMRPVVEAQAVERLMGREGKTIDVRRHPVIEIRPAGTGYAVEMIVTPDAWFYQENFIGKLSIERHLLSFHKMVASLDENFRLGFWQGLHLDDMHLTPKFLNHRLVLEKWMSTYCDGRDYFRVGLWSDSAEAEPAEIFKAMHKLYGIYEYIAWSGSNDFRAFYRGVPAQA